MARRWKRWVLIGGGAVALLSGFVALRIHISRNKVAPPAPLVMDGVDLHGDPLPAGASARLGTVRFRSTTWTNLLFLPDDARVISGGFQEEVVVWDASTGERLQTLEGHRVPLEVPLHEYRRRDWHRLFTDGDARVTSGTLRQIWIDAAGETLVTVGGSIRKWDLRTGARLGTIPFRRGEVTDAGVDPTASRVVVGMGDAWHRYDLRTFRRLRTPPHAAHGSTRQGDERRGTEHAVVHLTSASDNARSVARIYDLEMDREVAVAELPVARAQILNVAGPFAGATGTIWFLTRDSSALRLDVESGRVDRPWSGEPGANATNFALSPDGRWMAISASVPFTPGTLELRHATTGQLVWQRTFGGFIHALVFARDGTRVAIREGAVVEVLDAAAGEPVSTRNGHSSWVSEVSVSADGSSIATRSFADPRVLTWDRLTGAQLGEHPLADNALAFGLERGGTIRVLRSAPEPPRPADSVGTWPQEVLLAVTPSLDTWVTETGGEVVVRTRDGTSAPLPCAVTGPVSNGNARREPPRVCLTPDGRLVAWSDLEGLHTRDLAAGVSRTLARGPYDPDGLRLSPDGKYLIVQTWVGDVTVWDLAQGVVIAQAEDTHASRGVWGSGSPSFVTCVSPDGRTLATGGSDGLVRLWTLPDLQLLRRLRGHGGDVSALAFAPDGSFLASGSSDTTVLIWPLDPPPSDRE